LSAQSPPRPYVPWGRAQGRSLTIKQFLHSQRSTTSSDVWNRWEVGTAQARCWVLRERATVTQVGLWPALGSSVHRTAASAVRDDSAKESARTLRTAQWTRASSFCGQVSKSTWWMPRHQEPKKDVGGCDKPRGAVNRAVIRGCPNGETQLG
jgi:hypothetical protein